MFQQGRSGQISTPTTVQTANQTVEVQRSTATIQPPVTLNVTERLGPQVSVPPGGRVVFSVAHCNPGEVVTGGGWDSSSDSTPVISSSRALANIGINAWLVDAYNPGSSAEDILVLPRSNI